jgi:hypothetical protein
MVCPSLLTPVQSTPNVSPGRPTTVETIMTDDSLLLVSLSSERSLAPEV